MKTKNKVRCTLCKKGEAAWPFRLCKNCIALIQEGGPLWWDKNVEIHRVKHDLTATDTIS